MFTHDDIWRAIDRLAEAHGYSASGLAKKAGLDPTTFNKSKRISSDKKPRWPSTESVSKILGVTNATMSEFIALMDLAEGEHAGPATIPMMNAAIAGKNGQFDKDGHPAGNNWDEFAFTATATVRDEYIYALEVNGSALDPVYREGDVLIVSPESNVRRGDRVVVRTSKGEIIIDEMKRQTANRIELKSLSADVENRSLSLDDVSWVARILWVS